MENENLDTCQDDHKDDQIAFTEELKNWYLVVETSPGHYEVRGTEEAMQSGQVGSHIQGVQEGDNVLTPEATDYDDAFEYKDHLKQYYERTVGESGHSTPSVEEYYRTEVDVLPNVMEATDNVAGIQMLQRIMTARLNQIRFGKTHNYDNSIHLMLLLQLQREEIARELKYSSANTPEVA